MIEHHDQLSRRWGVPVLWHVSLCLTGNEPLRASPALYLYINDNLYVASISIRSETTFSVDTKVDTSRLDTSTSSTMRGAIYRHREVCRWWVGCGYVVERARMGAKAPS